jgi:hypothetical protein
VQIRCLIEDFSNGQYKIFERLCNGLAKKCMVLKEEFNSNDNNFLRVVLVCDNGISRQK